MGMMWRFEDAEEVVEHMEKVDSTLKDGREVSKAEFTINIRRLYRRYEWSDGPGPTPIPPSGIRKLRVRDVTGDRRWGEHFRGHKTHIAVFRTNYGFYWLLRFDPFDQDHVLEHLGSAAKVEKRFSA